MRHGLTVRGDSLYCPLALSLDSYANCLVDCRHCYFRRLNHVWGDDLNPINPETLQRKLQNGLRNPHPKSSVACALKNKTTIRFGNKTDPFQPIEAKYHVSKKAMEILLELNWPYVIQTKCMGLLMGYEETIVASAKCATILPIISPGAEMDWEVFERKRTTPISDRFKCLKRLKRQGVRVGVNGEPFIPGFHTVKMFEDMIKRLKKHGIKSYNTYNFHFNAFVAKRLAAIGIDVEKIWAMNQDRRWKPILRQLCDVAEKHNIILGCPDFVNVRPDWTNKTNTCCGIDVESPTTYNAHTWRNMLLAGKSVEEIVEKTWDGVGNYDEGIRVLTGKAKGMYTMVDAGLIEKEGEKGLLF